MSAVSGIRYTQGLKTNVTGTVNLVKLSGAGVFVSAMLTKQGGSSDMTFIELKIDGNVVFNSSIAGLRNVYLVPGNNYGIAVCSQTTGNDTVTMGFPFPIKFSNSLEVNATVSEEGVVQILVGVIHGTSVS